MNSESEKLAFQLVQRLGASQLLITTVESCTGGALANAITNVPGSGDVFKDGFVTYSNDAKLALGVPEKILITHTVYSLPTALAMARAGVGRSAFRPHLSVGITGSLNRADPDNPRASKVGEVYIAILNDNSPAHQQKLEVPQSLTRPEAKLFVVTHTLQKLIDIVQ